MKDGRPLLPIASLALGVLGTACIPILFPDLTAVLATLAVAAGAIGWGRARSPSARTMSAAGALIGVALLVVVILSVAIGGETQGSGGPAGSAASFTRIADGHLAPR